MTVFCRTYQCANRLQHTKTWTHRYERGSLACALLACGRGGRAVVNILPRRAYECGGSAIPTVLPARLAISSLYLQPSLAASWVLGGCGGHSRGRVTTLNVFWRMAPFVFACLPGAGVASLSAYGTTIASPSLILGTRNRTYALRGRYIVGRADHRVLNF